MADFLGLVSAKRREQKVAPMMEWSHAHLHEELEVLDKTSNFITGGFDEPRATGELQESCSVFLIPVGGESDGLYGRRGQRIDWSGQRVSARNNYGRWNW